MTQALEGRAVLITGASQGFGLAIARAMLAEGADIIMCARDSHRLAEACVELQALSQSGQRVIATPADVSKRKDVNALVGRALRDGRIHVLVNNAGVYGPIGPFEETDWDAWVRAVEINLLGSALMCRALIPHFKQYSYGKIIQVSGGGATAPLARLTSYAAAKAGVVRLTESLALELADFGIDVNAIAPGLLKTRLLDEVIEAGPARAGHQFHDRMVKEHAAGATPLEKGAALAVFLASARSDGITGRLISALWDPWADLPSRRDELSGSDIYTLRRILPEDRGKRWDHR